MRHAQPHTLSLAAGTGIVRPHMMRLALAQKVARGDVHPDVARGFESSGASAACRMLQVACNTSLVVRSVFLSQGPALAHLQQHYHIHTSCAGFVGQKATTPAAAFAGPRAAPSARTGGLLKSLDRPAPGKVRSALGRRPRVHPGAGLTGSVVKTDPSAESYVLGGESALDYRAQTAPIGRRRGGHRPRLTDALTGQSALATSALLWNEGVAPSGQSKKLSTMRVGRVGADADDDSSDDEYAANDFWDAVAATGVAPPAGAQRFQSGKFEPHPAGHVTSIISVDDRELAIKDRSNRRAHNAYMRTTLLPVVACNSVAAKHDPSIQRRIKAQCDKVLSARASSRQKQNRRANFRSQSQFDARSVNMPAYRC